MRNRITNCDITELQPGVLSPVRKPLSNPKGYIHELYLTGEVVEAEHYTDWFHLIRHATEEDIIIIHINSPGGDGVTAIQFRSVLSETEAQVVASIEGDCMSAATMIMLSCDGIAVAEHSRFLIHNYSAMTMGKGGEMYDHITAERTWSENLMRDIYKGFLTDAEITQVLEGKDFWMDQEEVIRRADRKQKFLLKEFKKKKAGKAEKEEED
jgi:ATP-dependent Clp protease protease subunit